ncbi:hypothetical protein ATANTOWER_031095 [Ataeniobius toweri]|uniref:Small integral membrane protein 5 n=1 Tax=Ataeniobius toweri TaxID=208326 RepID=A0ABU7C7M8_9TELE|nr:hypothetical protein [Ataeniobius toweri]
MEVKEELLNIFHQIWTKLQGLPHAGPLELGAFSILLLFVGTVLFMILLTCIHCCCCGKPKYQGSRVQPLSSI